MLAYFFLPFLAICQRPIVVKAAKNERTTRSFSFFFSRHRALDRRRSDDLILLLACSSHGAFMLDFCVGIKTSGASHRPNAGLVFWPKAPKKCQLFESSFFFIATVPKASQRIRFLFSFDSYYYYHHHYHHSYYRLKAIHERRGICLAMDSRLSFG